ncbi:hypothetical protein T440DRAFT_404749 [Plenodomus tracheiphilus IPT5]|uniref:Uncharacterized protein n=1 Tax=Plenodomus tracheiphilus IPT5 TaxID=1408161 RepID=A0A6A7AXP3_9PLEO|nr:hypothetical protein T440DRAFT_404749 [Plenodomus tracheiphilus IPT5]
MAAYKPHSHSPQVPGRVTPPMYTGDPITPAHSPHHSITSSAASRTPAHTITIHEYRKQQYTPVKPEEATPGKALRRKRAAAALNNVVRAPSVTSTTRSGSISSLRPLHLSQSAYQLRPSQSAHVPDALPESSFRSQSAVPNILTGSTSSESSDDPIAIGKVRIFNTRKRLPRPPAATGLASIPPPLEDRQTTQQRRSQLPGVLSFSSDHARLSDAQTTPTLSTFSLSRFPQPPHHINASFSPPHGEGELYRVSALSYSATAPATPPATPAIIHYRGASFDLVNPHDSLLLHNIVTPSREFDSSDYTALRTSEELFAQSTEMAPKRALYGDISAARAGIMKRPEDAVIESSYCLPLPPTPAAISPNSSSYTSPLYSPESAYALSPVAIRQPANDSRYSLKQLTRSLTKKLRKNSPDEDEEELQDMHAEVAAARQWIPLHDRARPLPEYDYVSTPQASYFPGHSSPMGPTSPPEKRLTFDAVYSSMSPANSKMGYHHEHVPQLYDEEPLTSLIPDDPSTQVGRTEHSQASVPEDTTTSKPYYDDLDSICPSSSIYTGDGQRLSHYQQSLASHRQSNAYSRYSGRGPTGYASDYDRSSLDRYSDVDRPSYPAASPVAQDFSHQSFNQGDSKTDTISKLIDEYSPAGVVKNSSVARLDRAANQFASRNSLASKCFDFSLKQTETADDAPDFVRIGSVHSGRPTIARDAGLPPRDALPLAPAFEYDEAPFLPTPVEVSGLVSDDSLGSYETTQNLLQLRQSDFTSPKAQGQTLEPSSSYSRPEAMMLGPSSSYSQEEPRSLRTPQMALDEAEKIFQEAVTEHQCKEEAIPAMWLRRNSGSQLLSRKMADRSSGVSYSTAAISARYSKDVAIDRADWETISGNSPNGRGSLDSLADYSSSKSSRNGLEHDSGDTLPSWNPGSHLSPARTYHPHDFGSSPPKAKVLASPRTTPTLSMSPPALNLTGSRTAPMLPLSKMPEQVLGREAVEQAYTFTPWTAPYALSDKETEELLASGPNDDILLDADAVAPERPLHLDDHYHARDVSIESSPDYGGPVNLTGLERVNTFEKLSVVGPLGNLTGTPHGTGMQNTSSSIADNSSPGTTLSSMIARNSMRHERTQHVGFYASPFPAVSSVTRISPRRPPKPLDDRTPSEMTLFPKEDTLDSVQESPSPPVEHRRQSMRNSTTFHNTRRISRSAVPGQTKLRQMLLAGDGRATMSSEDTNFSRLLAGSRPSTSDTNTPLHPTHLNIEASATRKTIAHENSPHLLCPEREPNADDEACRRKLSWLIFALFCFLPPCIILFRWFGDGLIVSLTKGRLGHTTAKSKRAALIAGIAVNVGLVTAILVPIMAAYAMKVV